MDFAIRLSCILALLFCLTSTGNAAAVDQDRQKLQELLRNNEQNTDPSAQLAINYDTVEIYKKYRGLGETDAKVETELDTKVNEFESKIELVEGVPKQGGGFGPFFKNYFYIVNTKSPSQIEVENMINYLLLTKFRPYPRIHDVLY